jgi:hypothetical protein
MRTFTPISPPSGPLMSFLNGLHPKSNFLAAAIHHRNGSLSFWKNCCCPEWRMQLIATAMILKNVSLGLITILVASCATAPKPVATDRDLEKRLVNVYVKDLTCLTPGDREWTFLSHRSVRSDDGSVDHSRVPENGWRRALPNYTHKLDQVISSYAATAGLGNITRSHRVTLIDTPTLFPGEYHYVGRCEARVSITRIPRPGVPNHVSVTWRVLDNCTLVSSDHETAVFRFQGDGDFLLTMHVEGVTQPSKSSAK